MERTRYSFISAYLLTDIWKKFQSFWSKSQSPATPRDLADVLASSDQANEFYAYLADMDETNSDETHKDYTNQNYLNFALKCNELRKASDCKY